MMRSMQWQIPAVVSGLFLALGLLSTPFKISASDEAASKNREYVILLHGMARSKSSMNDLEMYLSEKGYHVINTGYPSTRVPVEKMADEHLGAMVRDCKESGAEKIHIVTHSLGGIVTRLYLQNASLPKGSRIVMLSPPNRGSELADAFRNLYIYKWLNGPAGQVLGTEPTSLPNLLKPVDAQIGVITGNRSLNPFYSWLIPGEDDGKVSVERARLAEMADFLVVPSSHSFIMNHPHVLDQVGFFLKNGFFEHGGQLN